MKITTVTAAALCICAALALAGCGAQESERGGTMPTANTRDESYTAGTRIETVAEDPVFGDCGRLLFPVERAYMSGDTLGTLGLTWYSHIDPDETVEIVNTLHERAAAGETVFYDIYTDEEAHVLVAALEVADADAAHLAVAHGGL